MAVRILAPRVCLPCREVDAAKGHRPDRLARRTGDAHIEVAGVDSWRVALALMGWLLEESSNSALGES